MKVCAYYYVWGLFTCIALALLYNFLLIYIAGVLTWISIFVIGICIAALGFWIEDYSTENYPHDSDTKKYLDYFVYGLWGFTGIYFLCILCMYQSIRISIQVQKTTAVILSQNVKILLVPILSVVSLGLMGAFWLYSTLYLLSSGDISGSDNGTQYRHIVLTDTETYMAWY